MAIEKYLQVDSNGRIAENELIDASTGSGDAGKAIALDAAGLLDVSFMPVGIAPDTKLIECSENLSAGDFVNVWNDGGTVKVRKADATSISKKADGFVLSAYTTGQNALVYFENKNTGVSGLTLGSVYFLSDSVPGGVTTTPPTTTGYILQTLGKAVAADVLATEISEPIIRA